MKRSLVVLGALGVALLSRSAWAQVDVGRDYRRSDRVTPESPQNFALEVRFGPYAPRIDEDFSVKPGPYETTFGDGKGLYMGLEIDWQALRIPYIGTFGPGFGVGYNHRSANALLTKNPDPAHANDPRVASAEETYLTIMPMYLVGVLRIDVLARELDVPFVPYGKAGIGYGLWSTGTDSGVSTRGTGVGNLQDVKEGRGHTWGTHFAAGLMLLLDEFDEGAALGFDNEVGVNNSYIFFEWQLADLAGQYNLLGSGPQMNIGTSEWVLGVAAEF